MCVCVCVCVRVCERERKRDTYQSIIICAYILHT